MKTAVIVIPTYNEADNIVRLMDAVFTSVADSRWNVELLIVDSSSPDGTGIKVAEYMKKNNKVHLLKTDKEGLGKAYIRGFTHALEKLNPYLLFEMDADLQHNPRLLPDFLQKVEKGADFVIGSRYMKGGSIPPTWGLHRKFLSVLGNLVIRLGFMNFRIADWTSGYRAIKVWLVKKTLHHLESYSGYVFQVALLNNALMNKAAVAEVPLVFVDRTSGESKINAVQYMTQTLLYVFTHSSFIKFVIVGLLGFVVDFGFAYAFISFFHMPKIPSNIASAEIAIVFNFLVNNFWSFRHKKVEGGMIAYLKKLATFNLVSLGSVAIQTAGLALALWLLGDKMILMGPVTLSSWILYKVCIIAFIIIPYSYVLYNKVVWKSK